MRRGLDIAIALALGARGVLVGQPVFWALAAGGQPGVERALAILREEFEIALALLGAPTPAHLGPDHLAAAPDRQRLTPNRDPGDTPRPWSPTAIRGRVGRSARGFGPADAT